jgi:hypothetical protein
MGARPREQVPCDAGRVRKRDRADAWNICDPRRTNCVSVATGGKELQRVGFSSP